MTKKCKCGYCGMNFNSLKEKKAHKEKYPDGVCEKINSVQTIPPIVLRKSPIQKVTKITIPKEQAKEEWKKYCELLKKRKDEHLRILKESMYYAKQGKSLINVYEAIQKAGLNTNNEPRFAIARADLKEVRFDKRDTSSGCYKMGEGNWRNASEYNCDVDLPQNTFKTHWERKEGEESNTSSWAIKDKEIKTKVPIIPALLMPEGDLKNYYILWEVKTWEKLPEVKDPFLLKRISENMFVILGAWDITELERAIIGGLK